VVTWGGKTFNLATDEREWTIPLPAPDPPTVAVNQAWDPDASVFVSMVQARPPVTQRLKARAILTPGDAAALATMMDGRTDTLSGVPIPGGTVNYANARLVAVGQPVWRLTVSGSSTQECDVEWLIPL
jgi:hypothetical protein